MQEEAEVDTHNETGGDAGRDMDRQRIKDRQRESSPIWKIENNFWSLYGLIIQSFNILFGCNNKIRVWMEVKNDNGLH